jgi:hypothetical protein
MPNHTNTIFHKPLTWVCVALLSFCAALLTVYYFHKAYPIVSISVTMSRSQAEIAAAELAKKYNLGPQKYNNAINFHLDENVQNYVELEAGGKKAFEKMLDENLYEPYIWQVRHFVSNELNEVVIQFTPEGKRYGFKETIAETLPGAALDDQATRTIAETAAKDWYIDFSVYTLIESSKQAKESGRIDHTFTYERPNATIKEGRYRLKLVVSGDKLTTLSHFVYIPEAFKIRYREMRSANESIFTAANVFIWFVYFFLCGLLGIFLLLRSGFVLFRPALWWGIGIASLPIFNFFNAIPLVLFSYPTSISLYTFFGTQLFHHMTRFIKDTVRYTVTIIAAESLTRRAFGNQVQFWRSWSPSVASSSTIIGQIMGGYCFVPLFLLYSTMVNFLGSTLLGWWIPSHDLVDPNILATYLPWFRPLAEALDAGFSEECLFRAIPLASAALLGRWLGKERLVIILTLIAQALIFGAAHANYPRYPSYVRVVGLFLPSIGYGWLYLAFGLLPGIIAHFFYDVVLMALPLFMSTTPGIWMSKLIVVIASLLPVWVIIIQGLRTGKKFLHPVSTDDYNSNWHPSEELIEEEHNIIAHIPLSKRARYNILALGIISIGILLFTLPRKQDVPVITISRNQAIESADKALAQRNIVLDSSWKKCAAICSPSHTVAYNPAGWLCQPMSQHSFVWRVGGKELYHKLLGTYLTKPCWFVRYAHFDGDTAQRATEYRILMDNAGNIQEFQCKLPEAEPGNSLNEEQARVLAYKALKEQLGIEPSTLTELSYDSQQRPARRDWIFIFFDPTQQELPAKTARIRVSIAANMVVDVYRYVNMPEEWKRAERDRASMMELISHGIQFLMYIFFILAGSIALIQLTRRRWSIVPFVIIVVSWLILTLLELLNNWPIIAGIFDTSKPIIAQLFRTITNILLPEGIITAALCGLLGSYVIHHQQKPISSLLWHIIIGISCGTMYLALISSFKYIEPSVVPFIASSDALATRFVSLAFIAQQIITMSIKILGIVMFTLLLDWLSHKRRHYIGIFLIMISGFMFTHIMSLKPLYWWMLESLATSLFFGALYWLFLARDRSYIPPILGSYILLDFITTTMLNPYPGAFASMLLTSSMIIIIAGLWMFLLQKHSLHKA